MSIDGWIVLVMFLITYIFILFFERIQRTTAALAGAIVVMSYGMWRLGIHEDDAILYIRFDILVLLMSMMIIVNVLLETGFFSYFLYVGPREPCFPVSSFFNARKTFVLNLCNGLPVPH